MYDYYISLDWSQEKMAIAIAEKNSATDRVYESASDIRVLKTFLQRFNGRKILCIEESTASHWLWVELQGYVDEIIICDPYYNFLTTSGPKNDRIDAQKLLHLLRGGMLKPVYHSNNKFIEYRKLISTYDDVIKTGVRWKNRRSAILRAQGKGKRTRTVEPEIDRFTLTTADYHIEQYENLKKMYHERFEQLSRESETLRVLRSIPGIGLVNSVKIAAIVVDPSRFRDKGHFWSYCGLVKHIKYSGGRSYGSRNPRCCRQLKVVFKTAALATISNNKGAMNEYYMHLLKNGVPTHDARNKVARKIATMALSIMTSGENYKAGRSIKCKKDSGR